MAQTAAEIDKFIEATISSNKVVVFSKTYCPYCVRAKEILTDLKRPFIVVELDTISNGNAVQAQLIKKTNHRTVPQIFIAKEFIGGCDDMEACHRAGKLVSKLNSAFSS